MRVEGSLTYEDAVLLEKIVLNIRDNNKKDIMIDLADVHFLDSESAPILTRIEHQHGFEIVGIEIFLQTIVNEAEKHHN